MAGSIKKEGSSWYYVVTLGRKPNGKPNQKKKRGFRTKKEAEKALQEIVYEYNRGTYIEPSTMFYSELLKIWLEQKERTVQRTTYLSYKIITDKHIIPALGKLQISKIKPLLIHEFYNKLYRDSNLSGTSVQKIHMIIKDSLKYAIKMELIAKNPAESVDRPKREQVEIKVWNIEEIKRFLNESKRSQDSLYIAYHLALTSGMRQGEILGLRWKDIDFGRNVL
jgi:integrase